MHRLASYPVKEDRVVRHGVDPGLSCVFVVFLCRSTTYVLAVANICMVFIVPSLKSPKVACCPVGWTFKVEIWPGKTRACSLVLGMHCATCLQAIIIVLTTSTIYTVE
jgi:hypothetical protein